MKSPIIISIILIIIGLILFISAMSSLKWDFSKLSTQKYETNTHILKQSFINISVNTETAKVTFVKSDDDTTKVVCYEGEKTKHSVKISDNILNIDLVDERKWYDYIGIFNSTPKITVFLSEKQYGNTPNQPWGTLSVKGSTGDVEIPKDLVFENLYVKLSTGNVENYASVTKEINLKTSTGNVKTENVNGKNLKISVSTGDVSIINSYFIDDISIKVSTGNTKMTTVKCGSFSSEGSTGNIVLNGVIAENTVSIKRSTGNVKFDSCDGNDIIVKTNTGSVKGSLLTDKIFFTQSNTGKIKVPKTTEGGKCDITTDTGDIIIEITPKSAE